MKKNLTLIFALSFAHFLLKAQNEQFLIQPYLQDAEPNSIKIMWQTDKGEESIVEWGLTTKLGKKTKGTAFDVNFDASRIHEVGITGLKRFTAYYYRVKTGKAVSDIFQFKTPPFSSDKKTFRLVAMSDMQRDWQNPDKFQEVINEGVLSYLKKELNDSLVDNLALVMIPGDLVQSGPNYAQWKNEFFNPAEKLFSNVPVYPVPGNHERNSIYYFKYFSLPKNGTPAYAEHWWFKDYGNIRIIGLDSNDEGYQDKYQLQWLKEVLGKTAKMDGIDFVFVQLHHPYKSELWIPGEEDFTGKVVEAMEKFSTETGKPSIHFFGHTHGYSRGQSKDHKHLWVNVASAGGAIDNWGEFEGRDYDEFTVTQDEYGFVMVEVDPNDGDPKFTLKRISRGNEEFSRQNEVRDSITIWKNDKKPNAPKPLSPSSKEEVTFTGTLLKAGNFSSAYEGTTHAASQWQISGSEDFSKPAFDSWKQSENWYYKENRQKDDDLTDEKTPRLSPKTKYFWRVRYRDQHLNWSNWSVAASFTTNGK